MLAVAGVAGWQALTVHYSFGGNWTALYYTGALFKGVPAALAAEHVYVFPNSTGYDGQVYHYLAHDPLFRRNFAASMDEPRYRGRRILVPGLAFVLAGGQDRFVDPAYLAVIWLFTGLGTYWLGRFARNGLAFLLVPAVLISMDRLTVDVALAACCAGFALYAAEGASGKLYGVLVLAGLSRETGLLLPAAYCFSLLTERKWKASLLFATSTLPAIAWYLYLQSRTPPDTRGFFSVVPFAGILHRILHPFPYPLVGMIRLMAVALDLLALLGILSAIAWAGWRAAHRAWTPLTAALYLFAMLAILLSEPEAWLDVFAFGRTLTPLVFMAALDGLSIGSLVPACMLLAVDPRIGLQLGPQILKVLGLTR